MEYGAGCVNSGIRARCEGRGVRDIKRRMRKRVYNGSCHLQGWSEKKKWSRAPDIPSSTIRSRGWSYCEGNEKRLAGNTSCKRHQGPAAVGASVCGPRWSRRPQLLEGLRLVGADPGRRGRAGWSGGRRRRGFRHGMDGTCHVRSAVGGCGTTGPRCAGRRSVRGKSRAWKRALFLAR